MAYIALKHYFTDMAGICQLVVLFSCLRNLVKMLTAWEMLAVI